MAAHAGSYACIIPARTSAPVLEGRYKHDFKFKHGFMIAMLELAKYGYVSQKAFYKQQSKLSSPRLAQTVPSQDLTIIEVAGGAFAGQSGFEY